MTTTEALKQIVARVKADASLELADTADLVDEVGLDSLEMLQLMLEIEASLAIQIDFDRLEFSYLRSLSQLAAFLDTMPPRESK
jgi:acyl carrier protein